MKAKNSSKKVILVRGLRLLKSRVETFNVPDSFEKGHPRQGIETAEDETPEQAAQRGSEKVILVRGLRQPGSRNRTWIV